jgi:protein arginine N-methyltransferase 1
MHVDFTRVNSFKSAIKQAGKDHPDSVCVDIGSGIGTLALLCAKFGSARQIYAIEQEESILKISKEVAKAQGSRINNKIKFIHGRSFDLNLPEKANLLVTETIGSIGIERKDDFYY